MQPVHLVCGMTEPTHGTIDRMVQEYKIDIDSTKLVKTKKAKLCKRTRIFRIDRLESPTFIIDTPMTREIACYPHLVGESLEHKSREAAAESLPAILELSEIGGKSDDSQIVFEQILRAAPGYKLQDIAPEVLGTSYRTAYLRPRYTSKSYRDHNGMVQREIEIVHHEFSEFPKGKKITLVMQDTVASGRSGEVSINATLAALPEVWMHD